MKNRILAFAFITLIFSLFRPAKADEGMWIPLLLAKNYQEMQRLGLRLSPEQLYSVNQSSIKDAIVALNRGSCTGEMISSRGLMLTNHHCAYREIQSHSTTEANYLREGFWAFSNEQELPNPGMTVSFLVRIEDVTKRILKGVAPGMTLQQRDSVIGANIASLEEEPLEEKHYEAEVLEMFHGSEFYLYVYEVYMDVRLVGAPPSSIGKFGGDTDNWMWPRHTGDFALYRVYSGPDGKPAEYSDKNIPLTPRHFLPISLKGIQENDFAMIWGFPGVTDRYRTSHGIQLNIDQIDPVGSELRRAKMDAMKPYMDNDEALDIMYADTYAYLGNFWKKSAEQRKALMALGVVGQKQQQEEEFQQWVLLSPERTALYGNVLSDIHEAYSLISEREYEKVSICFLEAFIDPKVVFNAYRSRGFLSRINNGMKPAEAAAWLTLVSDGWYSSFSGEVDRAMFAVMMKELYERLGDQYKPQFLVKAAARYKGDWDRYARDLYDRSIFASEEAFSAFLRKPSSRKFERDPAFLVMSELLDLYRTVKTAQQEADEKLRNANRLYIQGLREMHPDRLFYPDANSSMRVTYGTVLPYYPRDAVYYHYVTFLEGVMQKEIPGDEEFDVPEKLKELYRTKDFGNYSQDDGRMPVCFLTDNDITGGNSGSPVINAWGHLIGTAFDGNSEAMSSDLQFDPMLQRTIVCDIRYVLFIIEKYAGATHLIDEMEIVR